MRFVILFMGCIAITALQAKPLDVVSELLKSALGKPLPKIGTASKLDMPDVKNIIKQYRLNSSTIQSVDLSKYGVDDLMGNWLKTAFKGLMKKYNINNFF